MFKIFKGIFQLISPLTLVIVNSVIQFFQIHLQPVNFLFPDFFIKFHTETHFQSCQFHIILGNFSVAAGGGVKYKISRGYFFLDASYNYTILNEVAEESRNIATDDPRYLYYYEDNDFRINFLSVSAGFAYSLYKPKKL